MSDDAKQSTPVPYINEALLKEITEEIEKLEVLPECSSLKEYFMKRVKGASKREVKQCKRAIDWEAVKAIYPETRAFGEQGRVDKLLQYYVTKYPAFTSLKEKVNLFSGIDDIALERVTHEWYKEFICYLKVKLKYVPNLVALKETKSVGTMTSPVKGIADFCLEISGPHDIINNLVFSTIDNDVQIRYHKNKLHPFPNGIDSLASIINLPYVSVAFKLSKHNASIDAKETLLAFQRKSDCEYDRFLVDKCQISKATERSPTDRVRGIDILNQELPVRVYTFGFLNEYLRKFLEIVRSCSEKVTAERKLELQTVINGFLTDITEVNLYNKNSVASNVAVCYVIGNGKYVRCRYVKTTDVNFIEVVTPLITFQLDKFHPVRAICTCASTPMTNFLHLAEYNDNLHEFEEMIMDPALIGYACTFCHSNFDNYLSIIEHYKEKHDQLAAVTCECCKQSVDVVALAGNRWEHDCSFD